MNYFGSAAEAAEWINGQRWKGEKNGLENTRALLSALGDPQNSIGKILHVAGTNGKGTTCAFLSNALIKCGYSVGMFTSPYLRFFNERIALNNAPIPDDDLVQVASIVREKAEALTQTGVFCTTFELLTACACVYYAQKGTDYAVIEVGMGGRLDSTNVLPSSVSIIATIGMDHMNRLGNTLAEIAGEKAGIMKPGVPAVVMSQSDDVKEVFRKNASLLGAPLFETSPVSNVKASLYQNEFECVLPSTGLIRQVISVPGRHQCVNAALALTALDLLGIDMEKVRAGVSEAQWPGRLQWKGNVLIDCGHNPQGARALKAYVDEFLSGRKKVLLTGMMQDKQTEVCSEIFGTFADSVVTTAVNWPRAISPQELAQCYGQNAVAVDVVENALREAKRIAGCDGIIIVAGSVYLAGDVLNLL